MNNRDFDFVGQVLIPCLVLSVIIILGPLLVIGAIVDFVLR
jgi:hypothetical protein